MLSVCGIYIYIYIYIFSTKYFSKLVIDLYSSDEISDGQSVSCSPQDQACVGLRLVADAAAAESARDETPTTNAALSTNGDDAQPQPQDVVLQPSHSRPKKDPADDSDDSALPASSPIDCGREGVADVMSDGSVTCHDAAVAPHGDVTGGQSYDVTPQIATPSFDDDDDNDDKDGALHLHPLESMPSETSPAVASTVSGIPEKADDGRVDSTVSALAQPVENEYRYVDEEHEYPDVGGSDRVGNGDGDVGDYYDVRDDYAQLPVGYTQNETVAAAAAVAVAPDRQDVGDGSRYSMNGEDTNYGVWNNFVDDSTLYGENVWKQSTTGDHRVSSAVDIYNYKVPVVIIRIPICYGAILVVLRKNSIQFACHQ